MYPPARTGKANASRLTGLGLVLAGLAAWFTIGPNVRGAPLMALAALAWTTPVLDRFLPAHRFQWSQPRSPASPKQLNYSLMPLQGTKETHP